MKKVKIWKKSGMEIGSWIFCLLFVLISVSSSAQKINEARYTYYISDVEYEIIQLNIHNDTREKILLWFEKDTTIQKKSIGDKVRNYFFSVKSDFSLVRVITEYGSTLIGFETDLFFTFYKIIEPQKSFLIQVICKIPNNRDIVKSLKKMIITATPMQMEKERMNIFEIAGLEQLSFRFNTLVIDGQTLHL
ncbi:MAG: hypothetical protein LBQ60_04060 [Bacteroidales bacterium]|nr:hypothetical protein [Bacteroidales bacterium]